jgi:5-methylcytosine-specific restriction protein A
MLPDAQTLAARASAETGLPFTGREGRDGERGRWFELQPAGYPPGQTFALRTTVGWRRLEVSFRPGNFAGELLEDMREADDGGRAAFKAVLDSCAGDGADIDLRVNGEAVSYSDPAVWTTNWRSMSLVIRRGMLQINDGDADEDTRLIHLWTSRGAAAVLALLPVETEEKDDTLPDPEGLPEGSVVRIEVNRYERDRRNRAAALAIHGYRCMVCKMRLDERYGEAAAGLIEVHHITPVSELGPDYIIDPRNDLAPLCPNCHSVAHRRKPPFSLDELREMLRPAG